MTPKEKLTKLLDEAEDQAKGLEYIFGNQVIADYLLANGVVVLADEPKHPPCWNCDHGWGSIGSGGYKGCEDSCAKLEAYISQHV